MDRSVPSTAVANSAIDAPAAAPDTARPISELTQNVTALQDEIERLETLIARRRELFNNQVYQYNSTILQLPALVIRPLFGWKTVDSFSASDAERERPKASIYAS